jgi:hypothetical protein
MNSSLLVALLEKTEFPEDVWPGVITSYARRLPRVLIANPSVGAHGALVARELAFDQRAVIDLISLGSRPALEVVLERGISDVTMLLAVAGSWHLSLEDQERATKRLPEGSREGWAQLVSFGSRGEETRPRVKSEKPVGTVVPLVLSVRVVGFRGTLDVGSGELLDRALSGVTRDQTVAAWRLLLDMVDNEIDGTLQELVDAARRLAGAAA